MTRIITYVQTHEHEKLTTTFFTEYFPSPSVCHKNKILLKIIANHYLFFELEKLIITFFSGKKMKNVNLLQPKYIEKYIDIHRYIVHLYIDISNAIYRYFRYIVAIPSDSMHSLGGLQMFWSVEENANGPFNCSPPSNYNNFCNFVNLLLIRTFQTKFCKHVCVCNSHMGLSVLQIAYRIEIDAAWDRYPYTMGRWLSSAKTENMETCS